MSKKNITFIKHRGDPNEATLFDGTKVYRRKRLWFATFDRFVETASYDNHFVYVTPGHIDGWSPMCTCGYAAGIVGYQEYEDDASPTKGGDGMKAGELVVCLAHAESGRHADGSS